MSYVNKAKDVNNVLYDLQDDRVYTLDLGDITQYMSDNQFQVAITLSSLQELVAADRGAIKFTMDGMPALCNVVAKAATEEDGAMYYQAMASLFMQAEEDSYTTIMVQCSGTSESQTAMAQGLLVEQEISAGGGGGATILEKTGLADWSDGMQMFDADSNDYNAWNNDDLVYIKFTPYNSSYTFMIPKNSNEDVAFGIILTEGYLYMAAIVEEDGSYIGMVMKMATKEALNIPTIYKHEVDLTFSNQGNPTNAKLIILTTNGELYTSAGDVWDELQRDGTAINVKYLFEKDSNSMFECPIMGIYDGYYNNNQYAQLVLMDNPEGSGITKRDWSSYTFVNDQVSEL